MKRFTTDGICLLILLAISSVVSLTGALLPIPHALVPQGIESVNGSSANMQCARQQENSNLGSSLKPENCLFDGISPEINTATSNWASELVTIRKIVANHNVTYDHVLLTFEFEAAVKLTAIELDVFLCPEWNISVPYISVYAHNSTDFKDDGRKTNSDFFANYQPSEPSCGCLSTIRIPFEPGEPLYPIWHIVVSFHISEQRNVQWVHVGEVRFLDTPTDSNPITFCAVEYGPTSDPHSNVEPSVTLEVPTTRRVLTLIGYSMLRGTTTTSLGSTPIPTSLDSSTSLENTPISTTPDSSTPLTSTPIPGSTPLESTPIPGSTSLESTPIPGSTPLESTPILTKPNGSTPLEGMPIPTTLDSSTPLGSTFTTFDSSTPLDSTSIPTKNDRSTPLVSPPIPTILDTSTPLESLATFDSSIPLERTPIPTTLGTSALQHSIPVSTMVVSPLPSSTSFLTILVRSTLANHTLIPTTTVSSVLRSAQIRVNTALPSNIPLPTMLTSSNITPTSTTQAISVPMSSATSPEMPVSSASHSSNQIPTMPVKSEMMNSTLIPTVLQNTTPISTTYDILVPQSSSSNPKLLFTSASLINSTLIPTVLISSSLLSTTPLSVSSTPPRNAPIPTTIVSLIHSNRNVLPTTPVIYTSTNDIQDPIIHASSALQRSTAIPIMPVSSTPQSSTQFSNMVLRSDNTPVPTSSAPLTSTPIHTQLFISPQPESTSTPVDHTTTQPDIHPVVIDIQTGHLEKSNKPPFLLIIIASGVAGLCLVVLVAVIVIGIHFKRRRDYLRVRVANSSGHQVEVYNPLYLCASFVTEGVLSDNIGQFDFTGEQESAVNEEDDVPLILSPIFPVPSELSEDFQRPGEITNDNIREIEELGSGHFGKVVLATTNNLNLKEMRFSEIDDNDEDTPIRVVMKKLKTDPSQIQQKAFDTEAKFMSHLKHPNVVRLLGVCYHDPAFIMMEYTEEGDLSQFLQRYTEIVTTPSSDTQIATSTLVYMASQIGSAMQYLASFSFIYRDLASRNCLVGKNFKVKVALLGVNRNTYQSHYSSVRDKMLLPIRWMATECFDGQFSEKTDVWAFGVTMWELFTLAKEAPYSHLSDEEVIQNALKKEDYQFPPVPPTCPQCVLNIMKQCWIIDFQQRATFQKVNAMLQACNI